MKTLLLLIGSVITKNMQRRRNMLKLLYDNVLIKDLEKKGKVIISDRQSAIPYVGEVIAVGPGDAYGYPKEMPTTVKVGDKVRFLRDRAYSVEVDSKMYYIVRERDIFSYERGN